MSTLGMRKTKYSRGIGEKESFYILGSAAPNLHSAPPCAKQSAGNVPESKE